MDTQEMIKQMCKNELNDSDIKAICKSRGFPEKEATSSDIFENFFISTIGIKEALDSLTYEEVVFLHMINKTDEEIDIMDFERLYGCTRPASGFDHRSFTQQYKETLKKVMNNLVRKGVLIIAEEEVYYKTTRMERLRFLFPPEFTDFLPPVAKASTFKEAGDFKNEILRDKLLEITGGKQKKSPLPNQRSFTLIIKDGDLTIGAEKFRVSHLLKWQQACWQASVETDASTHSGKMNPIDAALYALSQLKEHEWLPTEALTVIIRIFTGRKNDPEQICTAGWEWGCLVKLVADGKTYYRLPEDIPEGTTSPAHYLQLNPDGTVYLDLLTTPYSALEMLASISILDVHNSRLRATSSITRIGKELATVRKNSILEWLKEKSSGFQTAIELAQKRWGKQIIHENLMIARVKDLSLRVQIQRSFADPKILVSLPNDHIAFPCEQLPAIQKLVEKSGHVIKKAGAK